MKIFILFALAFASAYAANECDTVLAGMNIRLGLPQSTSTFVSGYLPKPSGWNCVGSGTPNVVVDKARGVFMRYHSYAQEGAFGVGPRDVSTSNSYSLFVWQKNGSGKMVVRICKWFQNRMPNLAPPQTTSSSDCLFNKDIPFTFTHAGYEVIGASWTGDIVTVHGRSRVYKVRVPGARLWTSVQFRCNVAQSCGNQIITDMITINATTDANGVITSYQVCDSCKGFPQHVFAVEEGGKIPSSFDFTNWFFLTNGTSPLQGRIVTVQPLTITCLWPIPSLSSNTGIIYFNQTGRGITRRCNGYASEAFADYLRFAINATTAGSVQIGSISLVAENTIFNFSCSNTSTGVTYGIPFGVKDNPFYCFVTQGYNISANRTFVGVMPADVSEIVVSRYGSIYVNGYKIFTVPPLEGVNLNFSSLTGSDFWTVAYANDANVLLDIENTYIKGILYCDSPLNKLKCQQQSFFMEDGFYPSADLAMPVAQTVVMLPQYSGLTRVDFVINASIASIQSQPTNVRTSINGVEKATFCVDANRFTTTVKVNSPEGHLLSYQFVSKTNNCPFDWAGINNYLHFGSICFSLENNGGCTIVFSLINYIGIEYFLANMYVTHTPGDSIISVQPSFSERLGFFDPSIVHLNVCTEYNIYGIAGKGIITELNGTYHTGIVYTDAAGALVSYKNTTTGKVYGVRPCQTFMQYAVVQDQVVGVMSASTDVGISFNHTLSTPMFYYATNTVRNCTDPVLTYASIGICSDGAMGEVQPRVVSSPPVSPITTGNVTVPVNFTVSIQAEYIQVSLRAVVVDCATYVCNGNPRCLQLLKQYVTACSSVENALLMNARLESQEVADMLAVDVAASKAAFDFDTDRFAHDFNITNVMPAGPARGSFIEDLLFDKVITNGLGTVDADYKACIEEKGAQADIVCRQYYNGISVLPALTDSQRLGLYSASLMGGMVLGAFGAGAPALPFSLSVFSKLNYVALQTDFIQENQKQIANAFNNAMSNITNAFENVNSALQHTSDGLKTVAQALTRVQDAVNSQGAALDKLTAQLAINFDAISSSIEDIYNRLDTLAADAQVDRLINGRLAALQTFVSSQMIKYSEVKSSRNLALQKVNECVKSQTTRFGFCGNGTHLFSMVTGAPDGLMFLHTVLLPTEYKEVAAWAGLCVSDKAYVLREPGLVLFKLGDKFYVTPRNMYQPRVPTFADFVQIQSCAITYVNITTEDFNSVVPDYIDVNKTLEDFASTLPNYTAPEFPLDRFNYTFLNLSDQIAILENKSQELMLISQRLQENINNINNTLLDLEWLDRLETYIKWPWWVWLVFVIVFVVLAFLLLWCCLATGCCGCCSCLSTSCATLCDCRGKRLQQYEVEKVHVQ
nr:spike glycoprotein [Tylonycteris robustula coronavirus]